MLAPVGTCWLKCWLCSGSCWHMTSHHHTCCPVPQVSTQPINLLQLQCAMHEPPHNFLYFLFTYIFLVEPQVCSGVYSSPHQPSPSLRQGFLSRCGA